MKSFFPFSRGSSKVEFFYESSFCQGYIKQRVMSFSKFLAYIGGLFGLIAGVSMISFVEFFYFFVCKLYHRKSINQIDPNIFDRKTDKAPGSLNQDNIIYQFYKYFSEFSMETSIHGLIYTASKDQSVVIRVFWIIVMLLSTVTCGLLIQDNLKHAELNPVAFGIDEKLWSVDEVEFPAVTYCPDIDTKVGMRHKDCWFANSPCSLNLTSKTL